MSQDSVKTLMTSGVISVLTDTSILTAIDIILTNKFNGIPVTDKSGVIIGILTKYDLIIKRANINDDSKVGDVMNTDPLVLSDDATVDEAIAAFTEHHRVDPIPVVNSERKVIGIISRADMVKLFQDYGVSFASGSGQPSPSPKTKNNTLWLAAGLISLIVLAVLVYYFIL